MKISITLLALATLFHTALGKIGKIGGDCNVKLMVCETRSNPKKPMINLMVCEKKHWTVKEDCSKKGMICVQPPLAEKRDAFCSAPF